MSDSDEELTTWLRNLYPLLATPEKSARFCAVVRRELDDGRKLGIARMTGVRQIADETWRTPCVSHHE